MMELYQTVEDRNNPDYLEKNGPILCKENPWLGPGYYFWDTFYENAEWWGRVHYAGNYMICSESSSKEDEMLDLVGNTSHLIEIQEAANKFRKRFPDEKLRVARVLAFIKGEVKTFPYKAVRANPINSKHYTEDMEDQIVYFAGHSYLELFPPIQVCVYDKCFLSGNFQVIYPPEYKQGFTI